MKNEIINLLQASAPQLLQGAATTLQIWFCATAMAFCTGSLWGIFSCQRLQIAGISRIINVGTFVLRAIPFYVQLLIAYFVLPNLLRISLSPFSTGVIALGLCSGGYICQIVRAGINSIPDGQWEACYVLGYGKINTLRYIILPQMLKNVVPALSGEVDQLLKSTSILSSIGFLELTRMGLNIISREMAPVTIYLSIAVIYMCMSTLLNVVSGKLEKTFSYDGEK